MSHRRPPFGIPLPMYFACLIGLVLAAACTWLCDDAYISFRYAKNLADGYGLAFNPGASPPVEGYSNLSWVIILTFFEWVRVGAPIAAPILSIGAFFWLLVLVSRDLLSALGDSRKAFYGLVFFMTLPPMLVWATSGLETMFFCLCLYQVQRHLVGWTRSSWPVIPWAILTLITRVDGTTFLFGLLVIATILRCFPSRLVSQRVLTLSFVGLLVGLAIALTVRVGVHGHWIPHTVRVKVAPEAVVFERGVRYVLAMFVGVPTLALLYIVGAGRCLRALRGAIHTRRFASIVLLGAVPAMCLVQSISVGGDFMSFARMLVPGLPGLLLMLALPMQSEPASGASGVPMLKAHWLFGAPLLPVLVGLNALVLLNAFPIPDFLMRATHFRWNDRRPSTEAEVWHESSRRSGWWSQVGKALNAHTKPGETLIVGAIGALGYHSQLYLYDTLGLVDEGVGLGPSDPARRSPGHDKEVPPWHFLDRNPTYFAGTEIISSEAPYRGIPVTALSNPELKAIFRMEFIDLDIGIPNAQLRLVRYLPPQVQAEPEGSLSAE